MQTTKPPFSLLLILSIGAILRFYHLGTQALFFDEAWSWAVTQLPLTELFMLPTKDPHPILYYIILKAIISVLPATEIGLRLLSVTSSLLVMGLVSLFVSHYWNRRAAFYATCFIAFSTFDLYYAQETRMYTLFGLLWVVAYMLFIKATEQASYLFLWSITLIALVWTHFYGILVALVHVIFSLGWWLWQKRHGKAPFRIGWLLLNLLLLLIGTLPMLFILWNYRSSGAGGAWVPHPSDLVTLFALSTIGLTAARSYFLDSNNLLMPPLASFSLYSFALLGLLLSGIHAIRGLIQNSQTKKTASFLAFLLITVPIALIFSYAASFEHRMWAFKPFLGAAYLFYIWAGIGLSSLTSKLWRRGGASAMIVFALFSLIPYYTNWQKSDAAKAFGSLPADEKQIIVLLNPIYLEPLAKYYLDDTIPLWGASMSKEGKWSLVDLTNNRNRWAVPQPLNCSSLILDERKKLVFYGHPERIQQQLEQPNPCIENKILFTFHENEWHRQPPLSE